MRGWSSPAVRSGEKKRKEKRGRERRERDGREGKR